MRPPTVRRMSERAVARARHVDVAGHVAHVRATALVQDAQRRTNVLVQTATVVGIERGGDTRRVDARLATATRRPAGCRGPRCDADPSTPP